MKKSNNHLRIDAVDLARGVALVAMAIFHFAWDLENFGIAHAGLTIEPQWKYFARSIASSFLLLVGIGAWLAHHNGFSRKSFIKRIWMVGGAALIITIATWFATPNVFIFFGILHNIVLSSILILFFMRLPQIVVVVTAILVFSAPFWAKNSFFDHPVWWWSGLSQITPIANDYVPIFPWFGWVLSGLALARVFDKLGLWQKLASIQLTSAPAKLLQLFGRHSLVFYLLHQPIMIGLLYIWIKFISGT